MYAVVAQLVWIVSPGVCVWGGGGGGGLREAGFIESSRQLHFIL